jgi:hypothetical protein
MFTDSDDQFDSDEEEDSEEEDFIMAATAAIAAIAAMMAIVILRRRGFVRSFLNGVVFGPGLGLNHTADTCASQTTGRKRNFSKE